MLNLFRRIFGRPHREAPPGVFDAIDLPQLLETVRKEGNPDRRDAIGQTPLAVAAHANSYSTAQSLLALGANPSAADVLGEWPLLIAARLGHQEIVELLLAAGAEVNGNHVEGWTPIMVAALRGHASIVRSLLAAAPDLRRKTMAGFDVHHMARVSKNSEVLTLLAPRQGV